MSQNTKENVKPVFDILHSNCGAGASVGSSLDQLEQPPSPHSHNTGQDFGPQVQRLKRCNKREENIIDNVDDGNTCSSSSFITVLEC